MLTHAAEESASEARSRVRAWPGAHSFLTLLLIAFAGVALPLGAGLALHALRVGDIATQSEIALHNAVVITQDTRVLSELVTAMERAARQYHVLGDGERLAAYTERRRDFADLLQRIGQLAPESSRQELAALESLEAALFGALSVLPPGGQALQLALEDFNAIRDHTATLTAQTFRRVSEEAALLREMARGAQRMLYWQAIALVPLALAAAALFSFLLARPVRQIDRAIHRLGAGDMRSEIRVRGPRDLVELGQRLAWLRDRLHRLEQQKRSFLRNVSHELKTPLATLREGAELLRDGTLGPMTREQTEVADLLQRSSVQLAGQIDDLVAVSRVAAAGPDSWVGRVDLATVVRRVMESHRLPIRKRRIRCDPDLQPAPVIADPDQLAILVNNLVSNAVKYTPADGCIRIVLRSQADTVTLDVIDAGPGIDASEAVRLFDPFFQGRNQPGGPVKGTGLGLAIARDCAQAHGGDIAIVDTGGAGAHFRVTLPRAAEEN